MPTYVKKEADFKADLIRNAVSEEQEAFPNPVPAITTMSQTG